MRKSPVATFVLLDAALVVLFCLIGRRSHAESALAFDVLRTVWPFLSGLAIGWIILWRTRFPAAGFAAGAVVWLSTLIGGMLLRALSGQGTAVGFVIVAATVLAVFLLGWRAVWAVARRRTTART